MSRIDDLIRKHCPDGVQYMALHDVLACERSAKYLVSSTAYSPSYATPVLTAGKTFILGHTDEESGIYPASPLRPVIIFDDFTTAFKWVDFRFKAKSSVMKMLTVRPGAPTTLRFLWYAMQAIRYSPYEHTSQWLSTYSKFRVPMPPLEVQSEIVRALDLFQSLEAELEAELEARRRQYEHYSDHVLVPSTDAVEVPLGELATLTYGYTASAADVGDYRFLRITDITEMGTLDPAGSKYVTATSDATDYLVKAGDLLMARTGATFGKTLYISEGMDAVYASFLIRIRVDTERLLPRYYWHFAQSERYWRQARALASYGGQPQFNGKALRAVLVPVPSLAQQERIVETLDKFDALVNDLSIGLPAELAARRKQYEYYRDRLLTFKEVA